MVTKADCLAEIKRFFKYYFIFCQSPDTDSVRAVLASAYSVNDKVRKAKYPSSFDNDEFLAIKAIRNYAIHQAEIYNEARTLPLLSNESIEADLSILCLLPISIVDDICESISGRDKIAIKSTCIYYKNYVDIYPCIFNFGVQLFLYSEVNSLEVHSKEYLDFKNSIEYERVHGYPHSVIGGFKLSQGGDVDDFIENRLHSIEERSDVLSLLYTEENGMYSFKPFN